MSGKNPLGQQKEAQAYEGVNVLVPVGGWQFVKAKRDPTSNDKKYPVGTLWLNTVSQNIWMQTQAAGVWEQITSGGSGAVTAVANGGTGLATLTAHGVMLGEGTSNVAFAGPAAVGTVLQGQGASADPVFTAIQDFTVVDQTGAAVNIAVNTTYISDDGASLVTFTLPAAAVLGQRFSIVGKGSGGWKIAQNAGQAIHMNSSSTTTGVAGSLSSTAQYNCVELICSTANTDFVVVSSEGTLTIV